MKIHQEILDRILERAIDIQQIPAPTFEEKERAEFIQAEFLKEGLLDVSMDAIGNVYGRLTGSSNGRCIVLSAHTDTVFPRDTDLTLKHGNNQISGPGLGDNSIGVAGLFGVLWALREEQIQLAGDVWLVANVGEEGLGDLNGMRAVVERFSAEPIAYIIIEGMALGRVFYRGLGVRRYRVTVNTKGGHSWVDYGRVSAIDALIAVIQQMRKISLSQEPRTTLNVGTIQGGTSVNTIAATASLELDLRSVGVSELSVLVTQVEAIVSAANTADVQVSIEVIGNRPVGQISPDHPLVQAAVDVLAEQGIDADLNIGSTDANIPLSQGLPAICVGLTLGAEAHTVEEYIRPNMLQMGMSQLIALLHKAFTLL